MYFYKKEKMRYPSIAKNINLFEARRITKPIARLRTRDYKSGIFLGYL
jgi:hypothetical protein